LFRTPFIITKVFLTILDYHFIKLFFKVVHPLLLKELTQLEANFKQSLKRDYHQMITFPFFTTLKAPFFVVLGVKNSLIKVDLWRRCRLKIK